MLQDPLGAIIATTTEAVLNEVGVHCAECVHCVECVHCAEYCSRLSAEAALNEASAGWLCPERVGSGCHIDRLWVLSANSGHALTHRPSHRACLLCGR